MENRRKLHDWGIALIIIGILNVFVFVGTIVASMVDGSLAASLANVEPDIIVAVKVVLGIVCAFFGLLVVADVLLGVKALKVSKTPDASKGYIVIAQIFLIMSCIATISNSITVFIGGPSTVDACLNVANSTLNVCIYTLFVTAAKAVRKDVLDEKK